MTRVSYHFLRHAYIFNLYTYTEILQSNVMDHPMHVNVMYVELI